MSFDPNAYIEACAETLDLTIPDDARDAVAANLARLELLARQLLDVELPNRVPAEAQRKT